MQGHELHNTSPERLYSDAQLRQTWKPLGLLNLYRLTLASLAILVAFIWPDLQPLGGTDHRLFTYTSLGYFLFSLLCFLTISWTKPGFRVQLESQITLDIIAIILMMQASGGVRSGLGMLLIATVAGAGMLMSLRMSILVAAVATLAVLTDEGYLWFGGVIDTPYYMQAGLLGITYFITAITAHLLARRVRESEALATRRGADLANMQRLTEYIIQRMQTGVMVVAGDGYVRLMNESASHLLDVHTASYTSPLEDILPELAARMEQWQHNPEVESQLLHIASSSADILPRFAQLGGSQDGGVLIFLEDTSAMTQQAQQLKLASLGRLTASIAHEIRNPLGAISHAGQLLAESQSLTPGDIRLTDIIRAHSRRMNTIVENILQLSRRQQAHPEEFVLRPWLELFLTEFCETQGVDLNMILVDITPADTQVRIDPSQLHQILWNLCDNGLRYSMKQLGVPKLELRGGIVADTHYPYLDVIDFGSGITPEAAEHIFEPFFTTEEKGTGLGLYISRELCESNQARLGYRPIALGGSCFRISFADPRRRQVA